MAEEQFAPGKLMLWLGAVNTRLAGRLPEAQALWTRFARPHVDLTNDAAAWNWFLNIAATPLTQALWAMAEEECWNQDHPDAPVAPRQWVEHHLPPSASEGHG